MLKNGPEKAIIGPHIVDAHHVGMKSCHVFIKQHNGQGAADKSPQQDVQTHAHPVRSGRILQENEHIGDEHINPEMILRTHRGHTGGIEIEQDQKSAQEAGHDFPEALA